MNLSHEQLFARFRATGDPLALGELFDRTSPQLLSLALHLCGNPADAEDALQATFVVALDRAKLWDSTRPLQPWLGGILTMQCRKLGERRARRREAHLPEPELVLDEGSPVTANERHELVGKLREHIDRLPQDQRQVLLLQLEHGLSPAEVAEVLGVPPGTVRMRLHRAVKALRGVMPAGLLAMMLAALPSRGLAAVRTAVLSSVGAGTGFLLLKKLLVAAMVAIVLAVGWAVSEPFLRVQAPAGAEPGAEIVAATVQSGSTVESPPAPLANGQQRVAVPVAAAAPELGTAPTGALRIHLAYQESGLPVPNVPLRVVPVRVDVDEALEFRASATGPDGACTIEGITPGGWTVQSLGGLETAAEVVAGELATVEISIDARQAPLTRVRGRVVHADGRAAGGATLVVASQGRVRSQPIGTADAMGWFDVPIAGRFLLLGARLPGFAPSPSRSCVGLREIELVLPGPGATVEGLVVDSRGQPVVDAAIEIGEPKHRGQWTDPGGWLMESAASQHLRTDASGRFRAVDLPAEEMLLVVAAKGFAPLERYITTTAGKLVPVRCELAAAVALFGKVVDQDGAPVAGASVRMSNVLRQTDAEGRFAVQRLAAGPLWLRVEGEGFAPQTLERVAGVDGEVVITVPRLRSWCLRFVDENAVPLEGWQVSLRAVVGDAERTNSLGRVTIYQGTDAGASLWLAPPGAIHTLMSWPVPTDLVSGIETTIVIPVDEQPSAVLTGRVLGLDGAPLLDGMIEVRDQGDGYLYRQRLEAGRFRFERVPAGDWVLEVHRAGRGSAGGRFPARAVQSHEVREVGALSLPREGLLQIRVARADGVVPRDANVYLFDAEGCEHFAPPRDGRFHEWPVGHYRWRVLEADSLWASGEVDVRDGESSLLEVVLQPGVRRRIEFPTPTPAWGEPKSIEYLLRSPDGHEYDRGTFDPREELPFRTMPAFCKGTWKLELATDQGARFVGSFEVESLAASREPIRIAVQPAR
ncbi:MAG: sigma-70 family RNA polymerase sigma factor [Planctomycetes bacterium]|nr:sigma-70 family RNA polymerase sigma factor [Planctomycetota bacterium]